jgi:chemosensory pili system protein ChpA (sensor histidine kinase/response regulator)
VVHDLVVLLAADTRTPADPPLVSPDGDDDALAQRAARILVVDDEHDHRLALSSLLEEVGYRVESASHGREALDMLLLGLIPDLVLLDLFMPVMDGWGLWNELKGRPAFAAIPVIVMSGFGDNILNAAPVSAGYLRKPIGRDQLLETIASCLWRFRRRSGTKLKAREGSPASDRPSGIEERPPPSSKR